MRLQCTEFGIRGGPLVIFVAAFTAGCDLLPGSQAAVQRRGEAAAAALLLDPSSAQFRNVRVSGDAVCGEINGRNRMGAYVGFTRFHVSSIAWRATLDPGFDPAELVRARQACLSLGSYASALCERATEQEVEQAVQAAFDSSWRAGCEGAGAPSPLVLPVDPTRPGSTAPDENWVEEQAPGAAAAPATDSNPAASPDWAAEPEPSMLDEEPELEAAEPPTPDEPDADDPRVDPPQTRLVSSAS